MGADFIQSFCPTKQHTENRRIIGFDIETFGVNNDFLCASFYDMKTNESFYYTTKKGAIDFIKSARCRGAYIFATNLSFDFHGLYCETEEWNHFKLCMRSAHLISAVSWVCDGEYCILPDHEHNHKITFLDTMSFCPFSVEKLGKIFLNLEKLPYPANMKEMKNGYARKPENADEWRELEIYNRRDSEVSAKAAQFMHDAFIEMGATPKLTIASTAMSIYRNRYLKNKYYCLPKEVLEEMFGGYYGARTEAFCRGKIEGYNYYDINSLYPSVMQKNVFPDINTLRIKRYGAGDDIKPYLEIIDSFEGMSEVIVEVPFMKFPPLPCRSADKLLFPWGTFRGKYTHYELRESVKRGVKIKSVIKIWYCLENCRPFETIIPDVYKKRLEFKALNDPREIIMKLIMNSLYGKFSQKFIDMEEIVSADILTIERMRGQVENIDGKNRWFKILKESVKPAVFCIPLWAAYVTSYGRMELLKLIEKSDPVYVDTDAVITRSVLPCGKNLGDLKLESFVREGVIVRPKFYGFLDGNGKESVHIKGVNGVKNFDDFLNIVKSGQADFRRFARFKEALRHEYKQNQILQQHKVLNLNDDKRLWEKVFNHKEFQESRPAQMRYDGKENVRI